MHISGCLTPWSDYFLALHTQSANPNELERLESGMMVQTACGYDPCCSSNMGMVQTGDAGCRQAVLVVASPQPPLTMALT